MTQRIGISAVENIWSDAQRVDQTDMNVEQNRNNQIDAATIQNHFGSGVLLSALQPNVIFDSNFLSPDQSALVASGNFDGGGISVTSQPSDINLGNQLEVELTDSIVFGRLSVKVAIIGVAFDGTIQLDKFIFHRNEKQVTSKHYKTILSVFFNDFKGNLNCSRNQGGRIIIRETSSFEISKDPIMVSQSVEPDIFWRDWKLPSLNTTLYNTIQAGIGSEFTVDSLNITTTGQPNLVLQAGDVTSQIGEKFQATTNNIQKITLLLGTDLNSSLPDTNQFDWSGQLVISIYPLQTTVSCPSDIVPGLAIDFDPANQPLAQLSFSQANLLDNGYVLTNILQPVDFVFSATQVGALNTIVTNQFYAITLRRVGSATTGDILIGVGTDRLDNARVTLFSGVWVDVPNQDLWFQVWTDAAKIADGQGYDLGNGISIDKTIIDSTTGATIDNQTFRHFPLINTGSNVLNTGVIQAIFSETETVQDERTGNDIFSRKQFVPSFSFVDPTGLANLKATSEPLTIGALQDGNPKLNPNLSKNQLIPGLAKGDMFCIVNPDADLLSLNLLGSKIYPNALSSNSYRIYRSTLCQNIIGDVSGDGNIDASDVTAASALIGESIYYTSTQKKIAEGQIGTLNLIRCDVDLDGYITTNDVDLISQYVAREINSFPAGSTFNSLCLQVQQSTGRFDGYFDCNGLIRIDGYNNNINIINPSILSPSDLIYDGYLSTPLIDLDPIFNTVPFPGVNYNIISQPFWSSDCLYVSSATRLVPATFSFPNAIIQPSSPNQCQDHNAVIPANDPGRNDFFIPNNLYIGSGQILNPDGSNYKVDFEVGTIILQLPQIPFTESSINIFSKLVADRGDTFAGAGVGFPAMRYSDFSTVQPADLFLNRVRFSVSIQAISTNADGYQFSTDGYTEELGVIVDDNLGIFIDNNTGILVISAKNLETSNIFMSQITKIQILVYLKKGGFVNMPITITPNQIQGLISS